MPDFIGKITQLEEERKDITGEESNLDSPSSNNNQPQEEPQISLQGIGTASNDQIKNEQKDRFLAEQRFGGFQTEGVQENYDSWSPDIVNENFLENASKNFIYGVGEMLGSLGDAVQGLSQIFGLDAEYDGNALSRIMQSQGEKIKNSQNIYVPEELLDPNFSLSTFIDPKFWSTHGARFIPQLLEIIATTYATGGVAAIAKKGAVNLAKKGILRGTKKVTTRGVYSGARGAVNEIANSGKGALGKILTDQDQLTSVFDRIIRNTAGGAITNMRVSLSNAGEMFNTYKDMKDENGNPIFSNEDLSEMARNTFTNNMAYMLADIASWGMTYGKGWGVMNNIGLGKVQSTFNKQMQSKYIGGMFSKSVSPIFKNASKLAVKGLKEGTEETIQESWEEWSKIRAYYDKTGSLEGYQGKVPKNLKADNLLDISSFMDYYLSEENEGIRTISFGVGGLAGGAFNIKTLVDKRADEAYKAYNRAESLKTVFEKGSDGEIAQRMHIRNQMAELIFEDKEEAFVGFIKDLTDKGILDQEDVAEYQGIFDEMIESKDDIDQLDINGKKAYINTISSIKFFQESIQKEKENSDRKISYYKQNISKGPELDKKIKEEEQILEAKLTSLIGMLNQHEQNKEKLLLNKKIDPVEYDIIKDQNGKEQIVPKEVFDETTDPNAPSDFTQKKVPLSQRAKNLFDSFVNSFKTNKDDNSSDQNLESISEEGLSSNGLADGAIEDLQSYIQSFNQGDEIIVDGEEAIFQGSNQNVDGTIDNFDYEIKPRNPNGVVTEEEQNDRKRNARLTKNNTIFDDRTNRVLKVSKKENSKPSGNSSIIDDDNQTEITDQVMKNVVDKNQVPSGVLNSIADKISKGDSNFNEKEVQIRTNFSKEIENILNEKRKVEEESKKNLKEEGFNDKESSYVNKASKRTSKNDSNDDFINSLRKKKHKDSSDQKKTKNKKEESEEKDIFGGQGKERRLAKSVIDYVKSDKSIFSKIRKFISDLTKPVSVTKPFNGNKYFLKDSDRYDLEAYKIVEQIAVNEKLEMMFPDLKPRAYAVNNLYESFGTKGVGYALAGTVFIDEKVWNQDDVFMHEIAHIYYQLTQNQPATRSMMNHALKNKKLVDEVLKRYDDQIMYFVNTKNPNQDFLRASKKDIIGEQYDFLSPEQKNEVIQSLINEGLIKEIPLSDQPIIAEEIFVHSLEGPLSKKYNRLFNEKDEFKRQFFAKKWWNLLKEKSNLLSQDQNYSQEEFLKELSEEDALDYDNAKEYIIDSFKEETKGLDLSPIGRAKIVEQNEKEIVEKNLEIGKIKEQQIQENLGNPEVPFQNPDVDILEEQINDYSQEVNYGINRLKYIQKASQLIRNFGKAYNVVLKRRFFNTNKNTATNWFKVPSFDSKMLQVKLIEIANESYSANDFIRKIEESGVEEIFEFNNFLKETRANDNYMFLSSYWWMAKSHSNIDGVKTFVDKSGSLRIQNTLNNKETATVENLSNSLIKAVGAYFGNNQNLESNTENYHLDRFAEYKISADNIRQGEYTDEDIYNVIKFFSNGQLDAKQIMKHGYLNINGKTYTLRTAVKSFLNSPNGMGEIKGNVNSNGRTKQIKKLDSVYKNTLKGQYMPDGVRIFLRSLVSTNRRFTADYTIIDANGNQYPVRQVDNFLGRYTKEITQDSKNMSKRNFFKKYAKISKNTPKGSQSNLLLNMIYENAQQGKIPSITQFHGIQNENTGDSSVVKESNSSEQSINEFLMFMETSRTGRIRNKSFLMEMGRFSDSPRSYVMEVPMINLNDVGKMNGNNFVFNTKSRAFIDTAYNIYSGMKGNLTLDEFKNEINKSIQQEIDFIESNAPSISKIKKYSKIMKNGKLTPDGKSFIAEYVVNSTLNGIYFNEIYFPSYNLNNRVKRAKSGISPGFNLPKSVQIEAIPFVDDYLNETDANGQITGQQTLTDAGMYVLEEDALRLEKLAGNIMPLGKGYKGLATGIENSNPNFKGKNIYHKGYMFILNDQVVKDNPRLEGLYNLMKKRRAHYIDRSGNFQEDLSNGIPTHFMYAIPMSSDKSKSFPEQMIKSEIVGDGVEIDSYTDLGRKFSLDQMNTSDQSEIEQKLDSWFYDQNDFIGMQGDNFVIQQLMDKETNSSNVSVQMVRAILDNASIIGKLSEAEEMQKILTDLMQENIQDALEILENGSNKEIRDLIVNGMNLDEMDPIQRLAIEESLSLNTPILRNISRNQLSNTIRKNGLKLKAPGTVAQQKPAHYEKQYGKTKGTKGLSYYNDRSDGGLSKGEAIVPSYMEGRVRPREIFVIDQFDTKELTKDEALKIIKSKAEEKAKLKGVSIGEIKNDNDILVGYYVEGDTIIATRIPSHGPQSTGVFEVIDFDKTGGSQVQLPSEFALKTTGGDFDGDQVFIQHKGSKNTYPKWNQFIDKVEDHWLSPQMSEEIKLGLDYKDEVEQAVNKIKSVYKDLEFKNQIPFTPGSRRKDFDNTLVAKSIIGKTANLHALIGMLSAYETPLKRNIVIDGKVSDAFRDSSTESRTMNSARMFNIVLDNAKDGYTDILGIDQNTVPFAVILRNLGYELDQIGIILNSPEVKEWSKIKSNKTNVFSGKVYTGNIIEDIRKNLNIKPNNSNNISIDTRKISDNDNKNSILNLISFLDGLNSEINIISKIMSGHNGIEINPFLLDEELKSFDEIMSNNGNKTITIPDAFTQNPLVKNYRNVTYDLLKNQRKLDPVYREEGSDIYERMSDESNKTLTKKEKQTLYNDIEMFFTSRQLGLNNISEEYYNSLINGGKNDIFKRMDSYLSTLKSQIVKKDPKNVLNSTSAFENSVVFTKGLSYNFAGNNKFISLNSSFFKEGIDKSLHDRMIEEFNSMPTDLLNDMMIYDLMTNGWKNPKSLFTLFHPYTKMIISESSNFEVNNKNFDRLNPSLVNKLFERILDQNPDFVNEIKNQPIIESNGKKTLNPKIGENILDKMRKGQPVLFKHQGKIYRFRGWDDDQVGALKDLKRKDKITNRVIQMAPDNIKIIPTGKYKNNIGIVSIEDESSGYPFMFTPNEDDNQYRMSGWDRRIEELKKKSEDPLNISGREARRDYYNFFETLSLRDFKKVMEFDKNTSESVIKVYYDEYLKEKSKADEVYKRINEESVKKMSDERLQNLFSEYGKENKFAYSQVLRSITMELARRYASEQSNITGKSYEGNDVSYIKSYLMSNNIPSDHPQVQALVRHMEAEYKNYIREKSKYVKQINKVTNDLYKEKFGFPANSKKIIDTIKNIYYGLFKDREKMYEQLYGSLVETEIIQTENGPVKNYKYRSKEEIERLYDEGMITDAEFNFYKTTTRITKELEPYVLEQGKKGRQDYIPHTAPDIFEKYSRRGLLGLLTNSKKVDEKVYNVRMNFVNPITGEQEERVPFKEIEDIYNTLSANDPKSDKYREFYNLKRKAYNLLKKGTNEDGTPIKVSDHEVSSALGDVFMNRFGKSRSIKATDLPSMDLNKAFIDYLNGALFTHGNENFKGMKRMLPYVDGILARAEERGDKNMAAYVDKIWKQYFLSGKKQEVLPTPSALAAAGITTDKTIDYLTKGSLLYWLGWKGLAVGAGAYAIGNVLVGKYNNLKNAGKSAWLKGEQRFWYGKSGKFDITDPFKGLKESVQILKNAGFMDINVYDDINVQSKNSLEKMFTNLALSPMIYSEKWIQGVHFLGLLSDEQWERLKNGGPISTSEMAELENEVKESHGKGYQATDQRMLQMYSWGRSMLQFSRYLPTMFHDRFAKEDINIYGKKHIGSYRAVYKVIQKVMIGEMTPAEFKQYRLGLETAEQKRLDSGLIGFGIMAGVLALNTIAPTETGESFYKDANALFDVDKLSRKTTPASVAMLDQLTTF